MSEPRVRIEGNVAVAEFRRFDLEQYRLFLRAKQLPESQVSYAWETDTYTLTTPARFAALLGANVPVVDRVPLPLAEHLFDYQRWIVEQAVAAKRFAIWADTGLGKTAMLLEWARQIRHATGGKVLILQPLQIIGQTIDEAARFYGQDLTIVRPDTREALTAWCAPGGSDISLAITNYEKLIPGVLPELRHLGGPPASTTTAT